MRAPRRRQAWAALVAVALVSGCGLQRPDAPRGDDQDPGSRTASRTAPKVVPAVQLTPGVVEVEGETGRSLTPRVVDASGDGGIKLKQAPPESSYADLCTGAVDVVDAFRAIEPAELASCAEHGLQVVQLQVAADAAVLAIGAESDVGGDCLSLADVENIYRAGSPVLSWADVGLDDVRLRVAGPALGSHAFGFFSDVALRADTPSPTYYRSDYHAFERDHQSRLFVTGSARGRHRAAEARADAGLLRSAVDELRRARTAVELAVNEHAVALAERDKGIIDQRPPETQASDQQRLDDATAALHAARAAARDARAVRDRLARRHRVSVAAQHDLERRRGNLAYFGFDYYELFEDSFRPFEITSSTDPRDCVFPSLWTVTSGTYPLARRYLLTTTTRSMARGEVATFLDDYLAASHGLAEEEHLIPLPRGTIAQQRRWVRGKADPVLVAPPGEEDDTTSSAGPVR